MVAVSLRYFFIAFLFVAGGLWLTACGQPSQQYRTVVFGTQVQITVNDASPAIAQPAADEVFAKFRRMHKKFHAWQDGELSDINRAVADNKLPVTVGAEMAEMLLLSADYGEKSEHLFNPAIGKLVSLWGFHADSPPDSPPPKTAIQKIMIHLPTLKSLRLQNFVLVSLSPQARLDFGAIAKGAALDVARDILKKRGVKNALINIGGNILAMGKNGGRAWKVAIRPARTATVVGRIDLHDGEAVATSGGGERFFVHGNRRYHHIIDPRTGYPSQNIAAVTVISGDKKNAGAISDAAATALVIADGEAAKRIRKNFAITLALRIFADGKQQKTAAMKKRLAVE